MRSGASRSLVAFWPAMARFRVSNCARSDSLYMMFSGIGTLGRLKARFASAIEPPTTQAADGIGRPLSVRSFTPAETRIASRSEEHTSELQSQSNLVCRLLLEKKKKN